MTAADPSTQPQAAGVTWTAPTPTLDDIAAHGNRSYGNYADNNHIVCGDGFSLSVIAGGGTYCTPRPEFSFRSEVVQPGILGCVASDYPGPYTAVEVGFPTQRPEPWECPHETEPYGCAAEYEARCAWACYAETCEEPTKTVYGYVPVDMVRALIQAHGGEKS